MTELIVCRHGATDWNIGGRYQGQADVPLNDEGRAQALALADELAAEPIEAVYSSALERAWRTAAAVAERHRLPVLRDARFNEINQGAWEGRTLAEIMADWPDEHAIWMERPLESRPPGGEAIVEVQERALAGLAELTRRHPSGLVVLVAHRVTITVMRCALTGDALNEALRVPPKNASFARLSCTAGSLPFGGVGAETASQLRS
jgi:broad specificity phosphatase PhoE